MTAAASIGGALFAARRRSPPRASSSSAWKPGCCWRTRLAVIWRNWSVIPSGRFPADAVVGLEQRLGRRLRHEPMAYILGRRGVLGLALRVDARVLVPRPETETLVEAALVAADRRRGLKISISAPAAAAFAGAAVGAARRLGGRNRRQRGCAGVRQGQR
ncbi:MAG: hypothetical protein U1E38_01900 [Rhodospirillales bacterium]